MPTDNLGNPRLPGSTDAVKLGASASARPPRSDDPTLEEFVRHLTSQDETGSVVRAHLVIEHLAEELLRKLVPNPAGLAAMRLDYSGKVRLLAVMGVTPNLTQPLAAIGGIRNEFAHKLHFKLTRDRMRAFYKTFDSIGREGVHVAYRSTREKAPVLKHPKDMWQLEPKDLFSLLAASLRAMLLVANIQAVSRGFEGVGHVDRRDDV